MGKNEDYKVLRRKMVGIIQEKYGLKSPEVLDAMQKIPRHKFVPEKYWPESYEDKPIDIGYDQTMSQPYTVAYMTHLVIEKTRKRDKILEVGTGSGYQAAILSRLFQKVYSLEIVSSLSHQAMTNLSALDIRNVFLKSGSGEWGWIEKSPYDAIMITAGVETVPDRLFQQLKAGGVLVAPVGIGRDKRMTRYINMEKRKPKVNNNVKVRVINNLLFKIETFGTFHFVPFVTNALL